MRDPVVYTMAILKDGKIIATKNVRTYLEGVMEAVTPPARELREIEFAWMIRSRELLRDILHHEGRWPPKKAS
jgi:hypothetical protein